MSAPYVLDAEERAAFAKGRCPDCNARLVEVKGPEVQGQMFECVGRFFCHLFQVTADGPRTVVALVGSSTPQDRSETEP